MKTTFFKVLCVIFFTTIFFSCEKETVLKSDAIETSEIQDVTSFTAKPVNGKATISFNNLKNGPYTRRLLNTGFGNSASINDKELGRLSIKDEALSVKLLKNSTGSTGGQFAKINLEKSTKSYTLSYRVKFPSDFEWSKGGKIPGLGGGKVYSGCKGQQARSNGDGWSSRVMWTGGQNRPFFYPYIYYNAMSGRCGNTFNKKFYIKKNQWYTIKMVVKMNTGTKSNGTLNIRVNGKTLINNTGMKWATKNFGKEINTLMLGVYRGGNNRDWWASKDTNILFDDFKLTKGS